MSKMSFLSFHNTISRKSTTTTTTTPAPTLPPHTNSKLPNISKKPSTRPPIYQPNNEEMKKIFDKFDTNGDGKISLEEYRRALRVLGGHGAAAETEVAQAFLAADSDGDGSIDFEEFAKVNFSDEGVKASEVEAAFRVFDADGDGKISAAELMAVLKRMGERCSLEACKKMIRGADRDGDGLIDKDEFINMMTETMKFN